MTDDKTRSLTNGLVKKHILPAVYRSVVTKRNLSMCRCSPHESCEMAESVKAQR